DRQFRLVHAAHEDERQGVGIHFHKRRAQVVGQANADRVLVDPALQQPTACLGVLHGFRKRLAQEDNLGAAITDGIDEGHMVDAGLFDPKYVVEQQLITVRGREAGKCCAGTVDKHPPQLAHFRVDAIGDWHFSLLQEISMAMLRLAMMMTVRMTSSGHMKRSHRSYGTRPMASAPMTTAKVGLIRFTSPLAD